jgi:hypothetical protein
MVPQGTPLVALAQQGAEAVGQIVTSEPSAGNPRGVPSIGNRSTDRVKHARSEGASSARRNKRMADNDAHRWITQTRQQREYGRDPANLRKIIDDRRHGRARTSSAQRCSLARAHTPSGRGTFHALAPKLKQVAWPDKFKPGPIDKYDNSCNPEEFIQVYHTIIEAAGGNNRIKANYLPTALSDAVRSWLVNLPKRYHQQLGPAMCHIHQQLPGHVQVSIYR